MHRADLIAGISLAGLMLPEAVAYSGIAGLTPQHALFAAVVGCLFYAALGRSRFAIVSPTSSSAAILAASLTAVQAPAADKLFFITLLVALAGLVFLIASAMRLGALAAFISRPVLSGFAFGLAVAIVIHQLPLIVHVPVSGSNLFQYAFHLLASAGHWQPWSVAAGGLALAALMVFKRMPTCPGPFLVLALGIAASWLLDLPGRGVATVGAIDLGLALPSAPADWPTEALRLLPYAFPIALILLAESWGTIRSLALRHGDALEPDRELAALGAANLVSALVQGMPVGAGFSAGAASEAAGAQSRWAAVTAGLGLAILVALAGGLVARLPQPVLAAVVIAALAHALDPAPLVRLWQLRTDCYVALAATLGVLLLGLLNGLLVAVFLSFAIFVRRLAVIHVARLGRLGESHDFVDVERHEDARELPGIGIWRPSQPLFFGNAEALLGKIAAQVKSEAGLKVGVISLEETFELDATALDALIEFDKSLSASGIPILYARVHDRVRDLLHASHADGLVRRSRYSVADAVDAAQKIDGTA